MADYNGCDVNKRFYEVHIDYREEYEHVSHVNYFSGRFLCNSVKSQMRIHTATDRKQRNDGELRSVLK